MCFAVLGENTNSNFDVAELKQLVEFIFWIPALK